MGARTKARKRAIDVLFEADQRGANVVSMLESRLADSGRETPLPPYSEEIVRGVVQWWVELTVAETEPGLQGDRSSGGTKPATLETGYLVQVPLFIETGEKLRIDTRTGDYMSRA